MPTNVDIKGYIKDQENVQPADKIKDHGELEGGLIKRKDTFNTKVHSYSEVVKSMIAHSSLGKEDRSNRVYRRAGEWSVNVKPCGTERLIKLS